MSQLAALYCQTAPPTDAAWLAPFADGGRVELIPGEKFRGPRLRIRWDGGEELYLTYPRTPDHERATREQARAHADRADGDAAPILEALARGTGLFFVTAEPSLGARAMKVVRDLQKHLGALLVVDNRIESVDGELLLSLPDEDEDEDEPAPPDAARVARRAMVLAAVVARSHMEIEPIGAGNADDLRAWLDRHDLWDEAELHERELLMAPIGELDQQACINGTWRAEGLVVLVWALGLAEIPGHDEQAVPGDLAASLGLFFDELPEQVKRPTLPSDEELARVSRRLLGLHWRMRDFSMRPMAMDFVAFSKQCWFGSFDIEGIPIAMRDLAIRGKPISAAPTDDVRIASGIAMERHQAINWLSGYGSIYSDVDTST